MSSAAVLDAIDRKIEAAELDVERADGVLREARALRDRLEAERRQARGAAAQGVPTAADDLDRIRREYVEARLAVQEAERRVVEAKANVPPLQAERKRAEEHEVAVHLGAVLDLRAALAQDTETKLAAYVASAQAYRVAVRESVGLGALLGIGTPHEVMDSFVARRLLRVTRPAMPGEFPSAGPEPSLFESDVNATRWMRTRVERVLAASIAS
jgi:hypothetical protein